MRLLAPRLQRQGVAGVGDGVRQVAGLGSADRQRVQAGQRQLPQARPLGGDPVLEFGRIVHVETRQEIAAVEADRFLELPDVPCAVGIGSRHKLGVVHPDRIPAPERHRFALDIEEVAQCAAQLEEALAQVGARRGFRQLAPQQPGQDRARLRAAVAGQEVEQGLGFPELEAGQPLAVQAGFRSAQESYLESCVHSAAPS